MIQTTCAAHAGAGAQRCCLIVLSGVVVFQQFAIHVVCGLIVEGQRLIASSQILGILLVPLGILRLPEREEGTSI